MSEYSYSRAQAIADGVLVDVTKTANEVGIMCPVAMTSAAWGRCVVVPGGTLVQDEKSRLWELLKRLFFTVKIGKGGREPRFPAFVDDEQQCEVIQLKALLGQGDHGEAVATIMLSDEA